MFVRNLDGPSLVQVIPDDIFVHVTSNAVCASNFFPHSNLAAIPQCHRNQQVYWFSIRMVRLHPTEAVHRMSLVPWVSRADWQLRPLEQGVKIKGVVCRLLSFFVDTLGNHCLSETWTDQALCTCFLIQILRQFHSFIGTSKFTDSNKWWETSN